MLYLGRVLRVDLADELISKPSYFLQRQHKRADVLATVFLALEQDVVQPPNARLLGSFRSRL